MYTYQELNITELHRNEYNPRKTKSNMDELVESIKNVGIIEPIIVRESPHRINMYEIVCGERRYIASLSCGLKSVPCMIRNLNDQEAMQICITENLVRKSVPPIEEAQGYKRLMELSGERIEDIADKIGVSASYVARRLQLNKLIEPAIKILQDEKMGIGHALEIAKYHHSVQKKILDNFYDDTDWVWYQPPTISRIKKWIDHNITPYLKYAPWDVNDDSVPPVACISCPSNTGAQSLIFPEDQDAGRCMNIDCFNNKQLIFLVRSIRKLMDSMGIDIPIVFDQYWKPEDNPLYNSLKSEFPRIITTAACSVYLEPFAPVKPDFSALPPNKTEEANENYQEDLEHFHGEMQEYQDDIKQDGVLSCIVVTNHNGRFYYEHAIPGYYKMDNLQNTDIGANNATSYESNGNTLGPTGLSSEDYTRIDELRSLIKKQEEKISRGLDLAFQKTAADIAEQFDSEYVTKTSALTAVEKTALLTILIDSMRYNESIAHIYKRVQPTKDPMSDYNQMNSLTEEESRQIIRAYLLQNKCDNPKYDYQYSKAKAYMEVMREMDPEFVKFKEDMYQEMYNDKAAKAREKVAQYNAEIKAIKENAATRITSSEEE